MAFHQYLSVPTVINLTAEDKTDALTELGQILCKSEGIKRNKQVIFDIFKHEEAASSFIGNGIAIPQAHASIKSDFAIAVGRHPAGIDFDAARGAQAHIIVLVLAKKEKWDSDEHIELLAEVASCFKSELVHEQVLAGTDTVDMLSIINSFDNGPTGVKGSSSKVKKDDDAVLAAALTLEKDIKASALVIFADAVRDNDFLDRIPGKHQIIIVTSTKTRFALEDDKRITAFIQAPSALSDRMAQIKIGILLALSRNLLKKEDKIICVSGNAKNGSFDTVVALDIDREFEFFFTQTRAILPPDVQPEVLERVLGLAGEIAVEGREGKPTGTIFVLGDTNSVNANVRQLIINPFRGYSEAERNIMDPGLDETIKEFASIDGAFIITGDGIVISAGSYLRPQVEIEPLPGGLGSRHMAAAAITACTNALAITISESTGTVMLFKNGSIMLSVAKPSVQEKRTIQKVY